MSESLKQGVMKCPECKEYSLVRTNRFRHATVGGTEERKLPIFSCKTEDCGTSVAVDPVDSDTAFMLSSLSS